ncbi:unnamed protein product [Enterobius vermicularis]|uniref:Uncharacterized protein n=1 Tax=Enterobius vermicularis TaxID=51028 RepID=A0A3P6I7G3_ENTVE|nr:unnamed protein product [Enterobius vermicularis]
MFRYVRPIQLKTKPYGCNSVTATGECRFYRVELLTVNVEMGYCRTVSPLGCDDEDDDDDVSVDDDVGVGDGDGDGGDDDDRGAN